MKATVILFLVWYISLMNVSCTAAATDEGCQRSCGTRPIGGGKLRGLALGGDVTYECSGGGALPQQTYKFFIYEDTSADSAAGSTSGSTSDTASPGVSVPKRIPKAGIAFTPLIPGGMTIDTPTGDWCTDSCGIATLQFTPTCTKQNVQIGVLVPGMLYDDEKGAPTKGFEVKDPQ